MNKKTFIGVSYVSFIIIIWGTVASLIDFQFLEAKSYLEGSIGQYITFIISGLIFTIASIKAFPIFQKLINK